jgi:hypothetical protein
VATKHPKLLWGIFIAVTLLVLVANTFILLQKPVVIGQATTGDVRLCINSPPILNLSGCANTTMTTMPYSCRLNATDAQQSTFNYTIQRLLGSSAIDSLLVVTNGTFAFTANNSHVGNYTLTFTVNDLSGCDYATDIKYMNLSITPATNDPYLVAPIPDQNWTANQVRIGFNLNTYFDDPNNDPLAFMSFGNTNVAVAIASNGEVTFTPAVNWCGSETVYFRATDPTNLSADSNIVTLNVQCISASSSSSSSSSGGGGGGGGGSSAVVHRVSCTPEFSCYEWSTCQLTRAVSPQAGASTRIEVTGVVGSRIYTIPEEYVKDPNMYYEGFEYRECIDTRRCGVADVSAEIRPCEYKPSCSDNILNQDEEQIDCGGTVCKPCGACSDGIQNGFEEGIDCGGTMCPACNSCTNGRIDGHELGVDCGGPDCAACPTCFDGKQNQDEEGVDCGGKYCTSCSETQFPTSLSTPWVTIILLVLVCAVMVAIFFAALKRRFAALLMEYFLHHKKKNRFILIPAHLKTEIIRRLAELEHDVDTQPMIKSQEDLARIIRDYFKEALGLQFEFTYEELVHALEANKLNPLLSKILQQFFTRISMLEFSGLTIAPVALKTLIQETRELVYQTAVLTIDDLKEREQDLALREVPEGTPSIDHGYLVLSQVHLALQFNKTDIAAALYTGLQEWYIKAPVAEQKLIYDDFARLYDEYTLAMQRTI